LTRGSEKQFIQAGKSTFTIQNDQTGNRFTFKVTKFTPPAQNSNPMWFVKVMTGTDNESSYTFIGTIFNDGSFKFSQKSKIKSDAQSVKVFNWLWNKIRANGPDNQFEPFVKFYHEGKCGRCGRTLTVPESITSGFGPECIQMQGRF